MEKYTFEYLIEIFSAHSKEYASLIEEDRKIGLALDKEFKMVDKFNLPLAMLSILLELKEIKDYLKLDKADSCGE